MTKRLAYLQYLETPDWWMIRKQVLARAGYHCERCHEPGPLEVHHRAGYQDVGREHLADLEVLCERCHGKEHEPRNRPLRVRETLGQARLFDRWDDPDPPAHRRAA